MIIVMVFRVLSRWDHNIDIGKSLVEQLVQWIGIVSGIRCHLRDTMGYGFYQLTDDGAVMHFARCQL